MKWGVIKMKMQQIDFGAQRIPNENTFFFVEVQQPDKKWLPSVILHPE